MNKPITTETMTNNETNLIYFFWYFLTLEEKKHQWQNVYTAFKLFVFGVYVFIFCVVAPPVKFCGKKSHIHQVMAENSKLFLVGNEPLFPGIFSFRWLLISQLRVPVNSLTLSHSIILLPLFLPLPCSFTYSLSFSVVFFLYLFSFFSLLVLTLT